MNIALIGYGKMGRSLEKIALDQGHSIVACITSTDWDEEAILQADVCLEFTRPECVVDNVQRLSALNKQIIIGTTGWLDKLDVVQRLVQEHQIGALYSPNFSIGIYLFLHIVANASSLTKAFPEYDVAGFELHHKEKKDAPSGTAKDIAKVIQEHGKLDHPVPFSSVRCGKIPGTHTVLFDSFCDTISITHEARNREGFAQGAIQAAQWIQGKKGFYTFADCMQEIISRRSL